jgi:CRP-like cAMP-binding protein
LRHCPLFANLADEALTRLSAQAIVRTYERGTVLFQKGDPCLGLYVIRDGRVKETLQAPDGREHTLEVLMPADICGESAMLLGNCYPYHATAMVKSSVLFLGRELLLRLLQQDGQFADKYARSLSGRILAVVGEIEANSLHTPLQRLVAYLLGQTADKDDTITLGKPKYVLASRLNMTPESLSRALADLTHAGIVQVHGKRIKILDRHHLGLFGS